MTSRMMLLVALCAVPLAARAQPAENPAVAPAQPAQPAQQAPPQEAAPTGFWERDTLTGNWGGLRDRLVKDGVTIALTDTGELLSNVSGGIKTGTVVENELLGQVDVDLDKLVGWQGGHFRVTAFDYAGHGLTLGNVGSIMTVSGIEAPLPSYRFWELWLEQSIFADKAALRLGLLAIDAAGFMTTVTGALFVGSTFGFPDGPAANLPEGGPAYPLSAPGVMLTVHATDTLTFMGALLSGDPAGLPGATFPPEYYPTGTVFSFNGGVMAVAQANLALNQGDNAKGLPASFKFGGWFNTSNHFIDYSTENNPVPTSHQGNWGLYATAEGMLYRVPGTKDHGLSGFARLFVSPPTQNLVNDYADTGLVYKGAIPGRGDDLVGVAFAYAHISSSAQAADEAQQAVNPFYPVRNKEMLLEVTYQAALAPWWTLQPVAQRWFQPGGNVLNPNGTVREKAVVVGLRTGVTF